MSRIGRLPIKIPEKVEVKVNGNSVSVKGPKGELNRTFHRDMKIAVEEGKIVVTRPDDVKEHRALHGLTRALLANMVNGVTTGFEKNMEISGQGYRAEKAGTNLILRVGLSSPVEVKPMPGITLSLEGNTRIKISGTDKELVGQQAANMYALRKPDPYKGKGIKYAGQVLKLKAGKAGKAIGKK
jgi:large subunit ribosomal protein L6